MVNSLYRNMPKFAFRPAAYLAAVIGIVVVLHEALGHQIDLVWVAAGLLCLPVLGIALMRFPAAFAVLPLFVPRLREFSNSSRFDSILLGLTPLGAAAGLLGLALLIRLLAICSRRGSVYDLFRGAKAGIRAYLLFAAVLAASYIYTSAPQYGGDKLIEFLTTGVLLFFAPFVLFLQDSDFRDFTITALVLALVFGAQQLFRSQQQISLVAGENTVHIGVGQLIGVALILILSRSTFLRSRERPLVWLSAVWLVAGLISAEARGPLISLIVALGTSLIIRRWQPMNVSAKVGLAKVGLAIGVLGVTIVLLATYWFRGPAMSKFRAKSTEVFQLAEGTSNLKGTAGQRLYYYGYAMDAIADKPLLGWGIGGWSTFYWHQDDKHYPHNLLMEVGVEQGIAGLVVLAFLLVTVFLTVKRTIINTGRGGVFLIVLSYCLSLTMFSGDLDDNRFLWFWCGAALAACRMYQQTLQEDYQAQQ